MVGFGIPQPDHTGPAAQSSGAEVIELGTQERRDAQVHALVESSGTTPNVGGMPSHVSGAQPHLGVSGAQQVREGAARP
jgi:hypothetical protein